MARNGKTIPKGQSRKGTQPTSTGKRNPRVDMAAWRVKLQKSRIKFDDDQAEIYLHELAATGLKGRAAEKAGVCMLTVSNRMDNDPDFTVARDAAMQIYNDMVSDAVRERGVIGWKESVYSKGIRVIEPVLNEDGTQRMNAEGEAVFQYAFIRKFSDRMLELEAKRTNPEYRDKQTIDLNTKGGGVLVAPAGMTAEEYIKACEDDQEAADKAHEARMADFKKGQKAAEDAEGTVTGKHGTITR